MKKRVKLLTTIASLCLAVALMAFGVYAAQSAAFSVKSSVSFTADGALNGTVKVVAYANATGAEDATKTSAATISDSSEITSHTTEGELEVADVALDINTRWIVYVVTFTASTTEGVVSEDATITLSNLKQGETALTTTVDEDGWYATSIDAEDTNKIVFAVYYGGEATLEEAPITFTVTLSCE